eukprot:CAMPEP_0197827258 /NCGR_PEP_ID=MMETSP1437-20131217/4075_1 /TAXON_ID=49252 ORGANISM="Eucampia antarctica, Strain CCMP1452" /NCGR_SAMPLE_ID=MMETSP1437 /ASSEMBLY_ACC=CAM_ASM_001096 /LENGTH=234 /DNA_ID=CAMNT_0043428033 /DNA_START=34 /DNA_END=738 /DNA_ORIENTATION=-
MDDQTTSLSPDQIEFTNAFNGRRNTLTAFASCFTEHQLHIVRDGFYLELAHDICPKEYGVVRIGIVTDEKVAQAAGKGISDMFRTTVESARRSEGWDVMVKALLAKSASVGSDLEAIWMKLERGRMEWLAAIAAAQPIKTTLQTALEKDDDKTEGDVNDSKMIWIYSLALSIPSLATVVKDWQTVVEMKEANKPLVGYQPQFWDCRKQEWQPLDVGVQAAAERAGTSLVKAWEA